MKDEKLTQTQRMESGSLQHTIRVGFSVFSQKDLPAVTIYKLKAGIPCNIVKNESCYI